jgi:hypothetical protein
MPSSGILCRVALERIDVLEERIAIIKVSKIGEIGTLAVTLSRSTQRFFAACFRF